MRFGQFIADTVTMTRRNVLRMMRQPEVVVFALVAPIMFVLLFNYVFGGSLSIPGGGKYINFLIPGILIQTAMFGGGNTAIGLAEDINGGALDRFRSLPMVPASVLTGRTLADAGRSIITNVVIFGIGFVLGFRANNGFGWFVVAFVLILVFSWAMTWPFAYMGLKIKSVEGVQAASFIPAFPLTFAASTFAPTQNMPDWLRVFAENQPVTQAVDAVRAMTQGGEIAGPLVRTLLWSVAIVAVFGFLAGREYRRV